eukprot:910252-Pelagomonas_calceolata.AAC.2
MDRMQKEEAAPEGASKLGFSSLHYSVLESQCVARYTAPYPTACWSCRAWIPHAAILFTPYSQMEARRAWFPHAAMPSLKLAGDTQLCAPAPFGDLGPAFIFKHSRSQRAPWPPAGNISIQKRPGTGWNEQEKERRRLRQLEEAADVAIWMAPIGLSLDVHAQHA